MDADSLYLVKELFYKGSYKACISEASQHPHTPSSAPDALPRALYIARAHLALTPPSPSAARGVLAPFLSGAESGDAALRAVDALARYLSGSGSDAEGVVDEVRDLVLECEGEEGGEEEGKWREGVVRVVAGTVFVREGESEEAVATLTEGGAREDLECMALLVHLCLSLDRRDLAQSTYASGKRIGNDSTIVQAMEAWLGLKTGARALQQSYYYYEELYQAPNGRTGPVLAAHAAAHLLLTHLDEARADVQEAAGEDVDVLAVGASLGLEGYAAKLAAAAPQHPYALDLAAKDKLFDEAAAKFGVAA